MTDRPPSRLLQPLLLCALLLGLLAVIPSPTRFHGDERFYTDAALRMTQTGDYWTPCYPDGRIRLLKPILAYWACATSFHALGVSLFAARLPFLLAGLLVVVVTGRLALTLWRDRRLALLAALIIASDVQVLTLSTRATPDVLAVLFISASMWGFARIWFSDDRSWLAPLLAYGGMGLAVQSKGLLGLCPLAANAIFCALVRPERDRLRRLVHGPAIALGLALGSFWYLVILHRHGLGALQACLDDQVAARVARKPGFIIGNLAQYLSALFLHAMPWTLALGTALVWRPRALAAFWRTHRRECLFLLSLSAVLVIAFTPGNIRRTRYLASSFPALAVLLAGVLPAAAAGGRFQRWTDAFTRAAALAAMALGGLLLCDGLGADGRLAAGGAILLAFGGAGLFAVRAADPYARWTWIAGLIALAFVLAGAVIRPVFSPSPLAEAVRMLKAERPRGSDLFTLGVTNFDTGQLRMLAGGQFKVRELENGQGLGTGNALLTTGDRREEVERSGLSLRPVCAPVDALTNSWLRALAPAKAPAAPAFWLATP